MHLDPFGGSGSTLLATQEADRRAALIELDPFYADVMAQRLLRRVGSARQANGPTWDEVLQQRTAFATLTELMSFGLPMRPLAGGPAQPAMAQCAARTAFGPSIAAEVYR